MGGELNPTELATTVRATLEAFLADHDDLSDRAVIVLDAENTPEIVRLMVDDQMFRLVVEEAR